MRRSFLVFLVLLVVLSVDAMSFPFGKGSLQISLLTNRSVRFRYLEKTNPILPDYVYVPCKEHVRCKVRKTKSGAKISTSDMNIFIDGKQGLVEIFDDRGKRVFYADQISLQASSIYSEPTYISQLRILSPRHEYLYGLGQFQDGYTNIKGLSRRLTQVNTQISIPMLISNLGYGLLWNNYGLTEFNPGDSCINLYRTNGNEKEEVVQVTSTEGGKEEVRRKNVFNGQINIDKAGDYSLLLDVGQKMARRHQLSIDGKVVIDLNNLWLPPTASTIVHLTAGKHVIDAELEQNDKPVVYVKSIGNQSDRDKEYTIFRSPVSEDVDFTVFVGSADQIIENFRTVTGRAPLMPKWALGYIHCRERFHSQHELLNVANTFRQKSIPVDMMVQDWQYWGRYGWNSMRFDEKDYPNPKVMVDSLHNMNMRLMVSVWSKIDPNSEIGKQMGQSGYYIPGTQWIDFFNPKAAESYWNNFSKRLLRPIGIDAWWQDATEPENDDLMGRMVMNGKYHGEVFRNVYPLLVNKTVYEGLRKDDNQRRSMILTRCGYPGIQRYGAAMWSGDVGNDWKTLHHQIVAGLGMAASGMPWWTFDAGGFFRPYDQYTNQDYIERMLRWIEVGVYLPLMRVHGYMSDTEPWRYGSEAETIILDNINWRYRLLPYIYSNAAEITYNGSTLMRPLVFDFSDDEEALKQSTEYMFGKSLLVSPILEKGVKKAKVYLPKNTSGWYDIKTNQYYSSAQYVDIPVAKSYIPVFARAGSILPLGPNRQYSTENSDKPMEIRIYPGGDAKFLLYDDDGMNYDYEKGEYSTILLEWNDSNRTFVINRQKGKFANMRHICKFIINLPDGSAKSVDYTGKRVSIKF